MLKLLLLSLSAALSLTSTAAEVYRWKDKDGVVHFGDHAVAPTNSERKTITDTAAANPQPANAQGKKPGDQAQASTAPAGNIALCAAYARKMAGNGGKREWLDNADKIRATCPGVGFECTTVNHHPEQNKCEPFPWDGKGTFFKDTRRDFPLAIPR